MPAGIDCGNTCDAKFDAGTSLVLTATPEAGNEFAGWLGACSGTADCQIRLDGDTAIGARFTQKNEIPPECAGLLPDPLPATQTIQIDPGFGDETICEQAEVDGLGTVGVHSRNRSGDAASFSFFDSAGVRETAPMRRDGTLALLPQPDGFDVVADQRGQRTYQVEGFDSKARLVGRGSTGAYSAPPLLSAANPTGGFFLGFKAGPGVHFTGANEVAFFGQDGWFQWAAGVSNLEVALFAVGADTGGTRALVVMDGSHAFGPGTVSARWVSLVPPETGEFALLRGFVPGPSTWFDLWPLAEGGLALRRVDGSLDSAGRSYQLTQWLGTIAADSTTLDPAAPWLAARPDTRLYPVRGGRAYAFADEGAPDADCSQRIEIVAASTGASCGSIDLPIAGGRCRTLSLTVGREGTITQQTPAAMEAAGSCSWRYWPAALR